MKQLRARTIKRQDERARHASSTHFSKEIYRLPSPFYRAANMKVMAGPSAERIVLITTLSRSNCYGDEQHTYVHTAVKGWLVSRATRLVGYFVTQETHYETRLAEVFETLQRDTLYAEDEGVRWARGWEEEARVALEVAFALHQ